MGKKAYRIWRIDPAKKAIAPLALDASKKDFALTIQRLCRASALGHRALCDIEGVKLCVAADAQADEGQPGFRFRGVEGVTAGIGVLFGQGQGGGLVAAPVDKNWIARHLVWTDPAETDEDSADDVAVMNIVEEVADADGA